MPVQRTTLGGLAVLGLAAQIAGLAPSSAAETTLDATYAATLGGFPIASGTLAFAVAPNGEYRATVDAQIRGLAAIIANRSALATASGRASGTQIASKGYSVAIEGGPQSNHVEMSFAGGAVAQLSATELHFPGWDRRVPLLPEHKRNVIDPLAAFVVAVPPGRDPMATANCDHTARVFDGRVRYDLRMVYGARMEVQGKEGYAGPALVCAVNYKAIAGYRPLSPEEEKFERNLEFSIWFVPLAGTQMLVPYKIVVGTPFGLLQVYAYRFEAKGSRSADGGTAATETTGSIPAPTP
ncbi:DUF3108 domain-containing protein [Siculibacillus lacustris]|uniref:DUF3108 domain-containing protein n=1 Tax=Siculibacillus lacustris TaxID=1549641 RepID=A0A4Q9VWY3_9HYPH|nr:DUF3108 domain-containing protein [Siculibacillus lacustris]TBW40411.1 DUF3108 domain-containing protein [Siculibacillus lacustris]